MEDVSTSHVPHEEEPHLEELWQFAGKGLSSSEFNTAMVHFYRGEITRSNTWRNRLDATTNWAVLTTGAALTFVFGGVENPAIVLVIDSILILLFLFIEARRYRYYELWTHRVRLMETNFFAALLSPPFLPHADWADRISDSLKNPRFPISLLEALGRRYRRNYAPIFLILAFSWLGKVYAHPVPVTSLDQFVRRAAFGPVPGWLMIAAGVLFNGALMLLGLTTVALRQAEGEVLDQIPTGLSAVLGRLRDVVWDVFELDLPRWSRLEPRSQVVYVISDRVEAISQSLITDLKRGVTLLTGTGMYTGKEHGVLMCALSSPQVHLLRRLVYQADPQAFVIVLPAQEVRGLGFRPLEA